MLLLLLDLKHQWRKHFKHLLRIIKTSQFTLRNLIKRNQFFGLKVIPLISAYVGVEGRVRGEEESKQVNLEISQQIPSLPSYWMDCGFFLFRLTKLLNWSNFCKRQRLNEWNFEISVQIPRVLIFQYHWQIPSVPSAHWQDWGPVSTFIIQVRYVYIDKVRPKILSSNFNASMSKVNWVKPPIRSC